MSNYERILFPTDFSDIAAGASEHAKLLADAFDAKLHVLHVIEDLPVDLTLVDTYTFPKDLLAHAEQEARRRLDSVFDSRERAKLRAELVLRKGSPFVEIVRYAREQQIDLIVMGTHGRGPIAHMLLGSVAEQVLRKAPCPVLVVRKPDLPFQLP